MSTSYLPKPHVLLSQSRQGMPWWKALAELVDNSFDASATRVVIQTIGRTVVVTDDGKGMKDVRSAVTLGDHRSQGGIGMYGVGLKDAWLSAGDKISIQTTNGTQMQSLVVDITQLDDQWNGPSPVSIDSTKASGTEITLYLRRKKQKPKREVFDKLAWVFGPAIEQGKQIVWQSAKNKKRPLAPARLPAMTDVVEDTFDIEGKSVEIKIGLMKEGERIRGGPFWIQHKHRIIESSSIGSKGQSAFGVAGRIKLGEGWTFTKNKDSIEDSLDELENEIHNRIWSILKKAEQQSFNVETQQLQAEIKSLLDDAVANLKREKRSPKRESVGTVKPKNTQRKRKHASKISDLPGSVSGKGSRRNRGFTVDWCQDGEDSMGSYEARTATVKLNLENPFVARCRDQQNREALLSVAVAILSQWLCDSPDGSQATMFEVEDFGKTFGRIIRSVPHHDQTKELQNAS